jgi:xanthine/CO dehydrogenase XdhC/CoxF family maturation factor
MVADNPRSHHPAGSGAEAGQQCARKRPFEFPILLTQFELSPQEIDRLHGPIGLDLGSKTPAEIAVSILAEIVAVRNGVSLKQKKLGSAIPETSGVCTR